MVGGGVWWCVDGGGSMWWCGELLRRPVVSGGGVGWWVWWLCRGWWCSSPSLVEPIPYITTACLSACTIPRAADQAEPYASRVAQSLILPVWVVCQGASLMVPEMPQGSLAAKACGWWVMDGGVVVCGGVVSLYAAQW